MSKRILIVNEELHVRILLERALSPLEDSQVEISSAENVDQALLSMREFPPAIILMDAKLPDAKRLCEVVRSPGKSLDIQLLVLGDKCETPASIPSPLTSDAIFISKPFDPDHIVNLACRVLGIEIDG